MFIVLFVVFLDGLAFSLTMPSMWQFVENLGASEFDYGIIVASFSAGTFIGGPLLGYWFNRRTLKESLSFAMILCLACNVLYAFAWNVWSVLFSRFFLGLGSGSIAIIRAYVSEVTSTSQRTTANALVNGLQILGMVLGPAFSIVFSRIHIHIGGRITIDESTAPAWMCVLLFSVAFFLLICLFKEERTDSEDIEADSSSSSFTKIVLVFLVLNYILSTVNAVIQAVASPFVMTTYHWGVSETGLMFAGSAVICIVGYVFLQKVTSIYRKRTPTDEVMRRLRPDLYDVEGEMEELKMPAVVTSLGQNAASFHRRVGQNDEPSLGVDASELQSLKDEFKESQVSTYDRSIMIIGMIVCFIGFSLFAAVALISRNYVPKPIFFLTLIIVCLCYPGTQTLLISVYSQILPPSEARYCYGLANVNSKCLTVSNTYMECLCLSKVWSRASVSFGGVAFCCCYIFVS
ncbi:hypothetical protein GEMRC1_007914 [Eukaryota sp. GEM-RC1]